MIEKIIRAKQTIGIKTREEFINVEEGGVYKVKFQDEKDFTSLLPCNIYMLATQAELEAWDNRAIPVLEVGNDVTVEVVFEDKEVLAAKKEQKATRRRGK